jgi:hypothetical protein
MQHLSVAEKMQRHVMVVRTRRTLACLRIQMMYRQYRNRQHISALVRHTRKVVSSRDLTGKHRHSVALSAVPVTLPT